MRKSLVGAILLCGFLLFIIFIGSPIRMESIPPEEPVENSPAALIPDTGGEEGNTKYPGKFDFTRPEILDIYYRHKEALDYVASALLALELSPYSVAFQDWDGEKLIFYRHYDKNGKPIEIKVDYERDVQLELYLRILLVEERFAELYIFADNQGIEFGNNGALIYNEIWGFEPDIGTFGSIEGNWYFYEQAFI